MKKYFILILSCCVANATSYAQRAKITKAARVDLPYYIGTTGIVKGEFGILGIIASKNIAPRTYVNAGLGYSSWRLKVGGSITKFTKTGRTGFAYGAGITFAPGSAPATQTLVNAAGVGGNRIYTVDTKPTITLNPMIGYHFPLGNKVTFYIQGGYMIAFAKPFDITYPVNSTISSSDRSSLELGVQLTAPKGLSTGIGFMFGLGK